MTQIRKEQVDDIPFVHRLNALAFETEAEADLVDVLREKARPVNSLVAVDHRLDVIARVSSAQSKARNIDLEFP